jgi:hypothetical protein
MLCLLLLSYHDFDEPACVLGGDANEGVWVWVHSTGNLVTVAPSALTVSTQIFAPGNRVMRATLCGDEEAATVGSVDSMTSATIHLDRGVTYSSHLYRLRHAPGGTTQSAIIRESSPVPAASIVAMRDESDLLPVIELAMP